MSRAVKVIRVDQEVYDLILKKAKPIKDTPNTVLRRLLGLDKERK